MTRCERAGGPVRNILRGAAYLLAGAICVAAFVAQPGLAAAGPAATEAPAPYLHEHDDGVSPWMRDFVDALLAAEQAKARRQGFADKVDATVYVTDFNDDGLPDMVVAFNTLSHCGTGGCEHRFYVATDQTHWRQVYAYTGGDYRLTDSRTRGFRDVERDAYLTVGWLRAVVRWTGSRYRIARYEDGTAVSLPTRKIFRTRRRVAILDRPQQGGQKIGEIPASETIRPIATVRGGRWHVVLVATGLAGYVPASAVRPLRAEDPR